MRILVDGSPMELRDFVKKYDVSVEDEVDILELSPGEQLSILVRVERPQPLTEVARYGVGYGVRTVMLASEGGRNLNEEPRAPLLVTLAVWLLLILVSLFVTVAAVFATMEASR